MLKKTLSLIIFLCMLLAAHAQSPQITYHNKKGLEVKQTEDPYFYRIIAKDDESPSLFKYLEFYSHNDGPKLVGTLASISNRNSTIGSLHTFYPNGQLHQQQTFNKYNQLVDTALTYYPNGVLYSNIAYLKPTDPNMLKEKYGDSYDNATYLRIQDSLGQTLAENGNGILLIKDPRESKVDFEQGPILNHKKNGEWTGRYNTYSFKETWVAGKLIQGVSIDSLGSEVTYTEETLASIPEYPGGIEKLRKEVANNYYYPKQAIRANAKGSILVEFYVDKDGSMVDFKILKDIGYGTGKELIRVLSMKKNKWTPGIRRGRNVRVSYKLPMTLNL